MALFPYVTNSCCLVAQGNFGLVEHDLSPAQFATAASPWPLGIRPTHSKVDGHHEFALANDDKQQHTINAMDHTLMLATVPRADEFQVLTVFAKHGVVPYPGPLPATAGGVTHCLNVAPKGAEDILAELAQAFEPGTLG